MLGLVGLGYMFTKQAPAERPGASARGAQQQHQKPGTAEATRVAEMRVAAELNRLAAAGPNAHGVVDPGARRLALEAGGGNNGGAVHSMLLGEDIAIEDFRHNNMQPHFRSSLKGLDPAHDTSPLMEAFTGSVGPGNYMSKQESAPRFAPADNRAVSTFEMAEEARGRIAPGVARNNTLPFEQERVGPGLGRGFGSSPGPSDTLSYMMPKNIDQLRAVCNSRPVLEGRVNPGKGPTKRAVVTQLQHNRPPTAFENDRGMLPTSAPTAGPVPRGHIFPSSRVEMDGLNMNPGGAYIPSAPMPQEYRKHEQRIPSSQLPMLSPYRPDVGMGHASRPQPPRQNERSDLQPNATGGGTDYFMVGPAGSHVPAGTLPSQADMRMPANVLTSENDHPGMFAAQIPARSPVWDPSVSARTTLRESTNADMSHSGMFGGAIGRGAAGPSDETRETIRQHACDSTYVDTIRNQRNVRYGAAQEAPDAPSATLRETVGDNNREHMPDAPGSKRGGFSEMSVQTPLTMRQFTEQTEYRGNPAQPRQDAYRVQQHQIQQSATVSGARAATGDEFSYFGIPRSDVKSGVDLSAVYNSIVSVAKDEMARASRIPGGRAGAFRGPDQATSGEQVLSKQVLPEPKHTACGYSSISDSKAVGSVLLREDARENDRLDPSLQTWIGQNPLVAGKTDHRRDTVWDGRSGR